MNLQEMRDYCRAQLDVDEEELPNALVDIYLSEAFLRTISMENRWPFYETSWQVSKVPGIEIVNLPDDCDPTGIDMLITEVERLRLMQIGNEMAYDKFGGQAAAGSHPSYYSIHGMHLHLWPNPDVEATINYFVWGHRHPKDWMLDGASAEPDCDKRLHQLLTYYAIALAYAQQEDEVLEDTYMKRWQTSYLAAHSAICNPRHHRPLIFNGGVPYQPGYNPVVWANPPVAP